MKPSEKRRLLRRLIEIEIQLGYEIENLIGYPLNVFNWDLIKEVFEKRKIEYLEIYKTEYEH